VATPAVRPADRYGDRRHGRRWLLAMIAAGVLAVLTIGWWLLRVADDPIRSGLAGWEDPADGVLVATVEVVREPGLAVTCDLVAVDLRQVVVGQTTVEIPAGEERQVRVRAEIPLEGEAVAPELRGCEPAEDG
jgi:Domain of unknown function (DUF4307)